MADLGMGGSAQYWCDIGQLNVLHRNPRFSFYGICNAGYRAHSLHARALQGVSAREGLRSKTEKVLVELTDTMQL